MRSDTQNPSEADDEPMDCDVTLIYPDEILFRVLSHLIMLSCSIISIIYTQHSSCNLQF